MHYDGFISGGGDDAYRGNVLSTITRTRNKLRDLYLDLLKSRTIPLSDTAGVNRPCRLNNPRYSVHGLIYPWIA
jgi:hypothetical protein